MRRPISNKPRLCVPNWYVVEATGGRGGRPHGKVGKLFTPPAVGPFFRRNLLSFGYGRGQNQTGFLTATQSQPRLA